MITREYTMSSYFNTLVEIFVTYERNLFQIYISLYIPRKSIENRVLLEIKSIHYDN